MYFTSSSGNIELNITKAQAAACSHGGSCDRDVESLVADKKIVRQLNKIKPGILAEELRGYGAWDAEELKDLRQNYRRILWLACCDINER
jgi:hypothetical protein